MTGSTLDPDNFPETQKDKRKTQKGHDTASLGPGDSSDSGSDMAGPGLIDDDRLGLDRGTNEDTEAGRDDVADAGPSVGDLGMDENSDRSGTGERSAAGKEPRIQREGDRDTDRVVGRGEAGLGGGLDQAEEARIGKTDEKLDAERANASGERRGGKRRG
jgi:hypothetical protein